MYAGQRCTYSVPISWLLLEFILWWQWYVEWQVELRTHRTGKCSYRRSRAAVCQIYPCQQHWYNHIWVDFHGHKQHHDCTLLAASIYVVTLPVRRSSLPVPYCAMCSAWVLDSFSMASSMATMPPGTRMALVEKLVWAPVPGCHREIVSKLWDCSAISFRWNGWHECSLRNGICIDPYRSSHPWQAWGWK